MKRIIPIAVAAGTLAARGGIETRQDQADALCRPGEMAESAARGRGFDREALLRGDRGDRPSKGLDGVRLVGTTDKPALEYKVGDQIVFSLKTVASAGRAPRAAASCPEGMKVVWVMEDDDGKVARGTVPLVGRAVPGDVLVLTNSLTRPGFVKLFAKVVDKDGRAVPNGLPKAWDSIAPIAFEGGAGVEPKRIRGYPEPRDFDGFWNRRRAQLRMLPLKFEKTECASTNPAVKVYAVKVDCLGGRPATGFMTVPAVAGEDPSRKYPVHLTFEGYGERTPSAPNDGPTGEIGFLLNAFGYELVGKDRKYYEDFHAANRVNGKKYALAAEEHADPANCHFAGMTWRLMRALDFLAALPEWNGKELRVSGGSQAGMQALWAAALDPRVTRADIAFPWCCDHGGQAKLGRVKRTWGVEWTEAMGYYDPVNFAKRIACPVTISRAGLGDYTCPPSGIAALWNSLGCDKSITWRQDSTHEKVVEGSESWTWSERAPAAEPVVVKPADDGRTLLNPDMGWVMHYYDNSSRYGTFLAPGDSLAWYPSANVVYLRLPWSWLEPEEGRFNWNAIDTPAQQWIARGGQVAFRITVSETMADPGATPEWVAKAGAKTIRWNWIEGPTPNGKFWECAPEDPVFLEKYGNFLRALAERYDGRDEVAFVDIGSIGIWGEGHTSRSIRLSEEETERAARKHIDLHRRHFKKTLVVLNDDFTRGGKNAQTSAAIEHALERRLGWRDDSIMVDSPRDRGWDYYFHAPQARRFAEYSPTILEIGHYHYLKKKGHWSVETLMKAIEDHKASFVSIHGDPRLMLDENPEGVRRAALRMGYRFQVKEVRYPSVITVSADPKRAERFEVAFTITNAGVAPCFRDAFPCLTLKDAEGGIVAVLADDGMNLKGMEGTRSHVASFVLGRWLAPVIPAGEHEVFVSVGRADGTAVYELPQEDGDGHRRYRVGRIRTRVR